MELRILPGNVADMIAAGEVVRRPASVVKELMENAVDAGADCVDVVVTDAGRTLIRVIDNGCGMSPDDAVLCFARHATSKIASPEDLHHILSFGFRGEALPSIAAVAEVTLRTRLHGQEVGVEVGMAASENTSTREVACPEGTDMAVRNLFYNIPARRKFLKSDSLELRHIVEEFQRVALSRPDIAFSLAHNGKDIYRLGAAASVKFRIQDLFGPAVAGELLEVRADTTTVSISGYAASPEAAKKTPGNQFFFANGRFFRSAYLQKAVAKAYENLTPPGTYPAYFLFLQADPATLDVNVHPAKTEIKFQDEQLLFQALLAAVREVTGHSGAAASLDFAHGSMADFPTMGSHFTDYHPLTPPAAAPRRSNEPAYNPFEPASAASRPHGTGSLPRLEGDTLPKDEEYGMLFEQKAAASPQVLSIGGGRFLVTRVASGLLLVHVRRARERLLYERFLEALSTNGHVTQTTLFPVQVRVGAENMPLFAEHKTLLGRLGFDIAPFGADTVAVGGVPEGFGLESGEVERVTLELAPLLAEDHGAALPELLEQRLAQKFATLGARGAYGTVERPLEAQALVDTLMQSGNCEFTPSGKRILRIVSPDEMEKLF